MRPFASLRRRFLSHLSLTCLAVGLLSSTEAWAARGDDGGTFGYEWRDSVDGATFDIINFTAAVTRVTPADNAPISGPHTIPFAFRYYGVDYTQVYASDNGWLIFGNPLPAPPPASTAAEPTPSPIPNAAGPAPMLAPFWKDLQIPVGTRISLGANIGNTVYRVQWTGVDPATGGPVNLDVLLFPDGRIKFQYRTDLPLTVATVGIENETETGGLQLAAGGSVVPGVALTPNYVVEFLPPPVLTPACGAALTLNCGITDAASPLPGTNAMFYACSPFSHGAQEALYTFTLTEPTLWEATLSGANNLTMFLLNRCSERDCIRGPGRSLSVPLGAGTYFLSVDGLSTTDQGPYTLDVRCTSLGQPFNCGTPLNDSNATGTNRWSAFPCAPLRNVNGPETIYFVDALTATNLIATLTSPGLDLDAFLLRSHQGEIVAADCVAWGDTGVVAWDLAPGQYLLVIDGLNSAAGDYTIDSRCGVFVDCSSPVGTVDIGATRIQSFSGDTTTGDDNVDFYRCDDTRAFDGSEDVIEIILDQPGQILAYQVSGATGLHAFILDSCNEGACVGIGDGRTCGPLAAGTYYMVIDSAAGSEGPYEFLIAYEELFNRWSVCEQPQGSTQLTTESAQEWHFTDGAYCYSDPASINFPNGCSFAMYATVRCGTELHIPLFDVESGHVRIFDVFRGEYLELTGSSRTGYLVISDDISWRDCTGLDAQHNDTVTDIRFRRPEGLCGVFRLEFPLHAGFVWDLFANCTGDNTPGFTIHDSLCTALQDYSPLPSLSLTRATAVYNCPDVTVTYDVQNVGCVLAENFPLVLTEGGRAVHTELIRTIAPGETVSGSFTATFTTVPTGTVTLENDPDNLVLECDEVAGAACALQIGTELQFLAGCGQCEVIANANVTPRICRGGTVSVSGATSFASSCPGGTLEYRVLGPGSPGNWQLSPDFTGFQPTTTATYTLEVRCVGLTTCIGSDGVQVRVDRPPDFDPASVQATDVSSCNEGIRVTWTAATFHGGAAINHYNIYRSTVSCAEALTRPAHASVQAPATSYDDAGPTGTVAGVTYYYVVEAEDGDFGTLCPPGPRGGAITRVDANGGTCTGVLDAVVVGQPDLLPRVQTSLRLGGDSAGGAPRYGATFVELSWTTDRLVSNGEHFHVLRSDRADDVVVQRNTEPPFLTVGAFTDLSAGHATTKLYFYLVFTADVCELDNSAFDNYASQP